jgi:hypothetical protein
MGQAPPLIMFFIVGTMMDHYSLKPVINGLSNHDAQLIVINNVKPVVINYNCRKQTRLINDLMIKRIYNPSKK